MCCLVEKRFWGKVLGWERVQNGYHAHQTRRAEYCDYDYLIPLFQVLDPQSIASENLRNNRNIAWYLLKFGFTRAGCLPAHPFRSYGFLEELNAL